MGEWIYIIYASSHKRGIVPDSLTIAVIVLALFPPVFLMMPMLVRLLAVGRVASGAAAMTLLLKIA